MQVQQASARHGSQDDFARSYLKSISRFVVLSREEEHTLAVTARGGNQGARARLINANLRLVVVIARRFGRGKPVMDLVQEGNRGLLEAVDRFDPHCGIKLSSYAYDFIRFRMMNYLLRTRNLVRVGTTQNQRKIFFNLNRVRRLLEQRGQAVTPENLAAEIGVSATEVAEMLMRVTESSLDTELTANSIDGPSTSGPLESPKDMLPADEPLLDDQHESQCKRRAILAFADSLLGREHELFFERLATDEPADLAVFAARWGISVERVRQIEARLVAHFRAHLADLGYTRPAPEVRWTQPRLLQHLATGLLCPPRLEPTARRLKAAGLIYRPHKGAWAVTDAGRQRAQNTI